MPDSAPFTWFTENPAPILVAGAAALLVLLVCLLKSGRGRILIAMGCVALTMALAMLTDRLIVTDREKVANVVYDAAAAAERNELNAVIEFISPAFPEVRAEARRWIKLAEKLEYVNISAMEVTLDRAANPPTATAEFRVIARGEAHDKGMTIPGTYVGRVAVQMRREGDRWMVTGYQRDN